MASFLFPPLVPHSQSLGPHNGQGLYRARRVVIEWLKIAVMLAAGVGVVVYGQLYGMAALYVAVAVFLGVRLWKERQAFGPHGAPVVWLGAQELLLPLSSRWVPRHTRIDLQGVRQLRIVGDPWEREFVFEKRSGSPLRVKANLVQHDAQVVQFIQSALQGRIPVEVPQTADLAGTR